MLNKIIDWLFPKRDNQCRAVFRHGDLPYNVCVREEGTYLVVNNTNCEISEINIDELYQGRMKK